MAKQSLAALHELGSLSRVARAELRNAQEGYDEVNERLIKEIAEELTGKEVAILGALDYGTSGWNPDSRPDANWHSWRTNSLREKAGLSEGQVPVLDGRTVVLGAVALPALQTERFWGPWPGLKVVHLVVDGTPEILDETLLTEETFTVRQQVATPFDTVALHTPDGLNLNIPSETTDA